MEIKGGIDPDALLDYVELQIFPNQNRYEAFVCNNNKAKKLASATLEQLLLHSPHVKDLSSKGSNTNFKILQPNNTNDAEWFTTTTFTRFLHIISSQDIFNIGNEINQLEETKKFQLSLSVKAEFDITSSIDSKNDLLRAVDLRLTALKDELVAAFDHATGVKCSTKDISDLENFAHHCGAKDIRDSLQKFVEMGIFPSPQDFKNNLNTTNRKWDPPIKYDENSSFSSEEEKSSVQRSRARTRTPTPRRSASPMRRVQIGRSGSHRAAALTIKSLNYFPPREKLGFQRDEGSNTSDEEKPVNSNVLRMSVKDKISLFESKQRDQNVDAPKIKKKGVVRRWSSVIGIQDNNNNDSTETTPISISSETKENLKVETLEPEREERSEWNQQKEAELNEFLIKEKENKPVSQKPISKKSRETVNEPGKSQKKSNPGKESSKPLVLKKDKPSLLAEKRKSWPSTQPGGNRKENKLKSESESRLRSLKAATPPGGNRKENKQPTKTDIPFSVSKKSSVLPLETKPFLRKGSGIKTKVMESRQKENEVVMIITDGSENKASENNSNVDLESEPQVVSEKLGNPAMVPESPVAEQIVSESTTPRVRRCLSEILLEENSEGDSGKWGNAEHPPPPLVYQKESPKGFKRLLKFGRKTRGGSIPIGDDHAKKSKATRSFFSRSFRSTKTNEKKIQGA